MKLRVWKSGDGREVGCEVVSSCSALVELSGSGADGECSDAGWVRHCVARAGIFCWCAALVVRFCFLWSADPQRTSDPWLWGLRAAAVLGTEACLLGVALLLVVVVPLLITTWTTALVCELIFGHLVSRAVDVVNRGEDLAKERVPTRDKLIRSGSRIARDMSGLSVAKSGAVTICFVVMISVRIYLRDV